MGTLEKKDYRLMEIALQNLLEIYEETGTPEGAEMAVEELIKLRSKLIEINKIFK